MVDVQTVVESEVCVIGSGVAGGVICQELLAAGVGSITMLEAGAPVRMREMRTWYDYTLGPRRDPFTASGVEGAPGDYNVGSDKYVQRQLRTRGGSTIRWEGHCPRLKPEDFKLHALTGHGVDWPISYDDLEPYYALAEATLQVAGEARDAGHPPRSGAFPLPALPFQRSNEPFLQGLKSLGYSVQHRPMARNSAPAGGMPQCQTIGTCTYCPIGGRFTGDQLIDRLQADERCQIRTEATVLALMLDARGRVRAARVLDRGRGQTYDVVAQTFLVCAGGIETPKLLLRSVGAGHSNGLGNKHGQVGKFLTSHVGSFRVGLTPNPKEYMDELLEFDTVVSRHFDDESNQPYGKFLLHHHMRVAPGEEDISGQRHWLRTLLMGGMDRRAVKERLAGPVCHIVRASIEQFPEAGNAIENGSERDALGLPVSRIRYAYGARARAAVERAMLRCTEVLEAMGCETRGLPAPSVHNLAHDMGTCRMSADPRHGVVDADLRVHGFDNLYVCGSAVFPTVGAANPTLTIVALAHRLGRHLAARLGRAETVAATPSGS